VYAYDHYGDYYWTGTNYDYGTQNNVYPSVSRSDYWLDATQIGYVPTAPIQSAYSSDNDATLFNLNITLNEAVKPYGHVLLQQQTSFTPETATVTFQDLGQGKKVTLAGFTFTAPSGGATAAEVAAAFA
uniref:hypothetical protein n=1 Tax=Salmonella enterica TaxID=28901 RepID=UPI003524E93C